MARLSPQQRREVIVEAALAVILRKGLASTTVRDVADQMGTSSGLIHHYYDSMDELLAAAFERAAGQALKIKVSAADKGGSGLDHVTIDYGDHSGTTHDRSVTHRYKRGTYTLKVAAVDKAGNVTRTTTKLKIKKK